MLQSGVLMMIGVAALIAGLLSLNFLRHWISGEKVRWRLKASSAPRVFILSAAGWVVILSLAQILYWLFGNLTLSVSALVLTAAWFGLNNIWVGFFAFKPAIIYLKNQGVLGWPLAGLMAGMGLLLTIDIVAQTWSTGTYVFNPWSLGLGALVGVFVGWWFSLDDRIFV